MYKHVTRRHRVHDKMTRLEGNTWSDEAVRDCESPASTRATKDIIFRLAEHRSSGSVFAQSDVVQRNVVQRREQQWRCGDGLEGQNQGTAETHWFCARKAIRHSEKRMEGSVSSVALTCKDMSSCFQLIASCLANRRTPLIIVGPLLTALVGHGRRCVCCRTCEIWHWA